VSSVSDAAGQLVCPSCGRTHQGEQRFCPECGLPLTRAGERETDTPISDLHRRARKIKPQLSEGSLVRVAGARNQVEGEFIQDLLLEQGVPSVLRRSAGFDVPDFLAAGPRDVLVPQSGVTTAREVLLEAELIPDHPVRPVVSPVRLLAGLLAALGLGALIVWGILQLVS
jgi:hypothetical protein